MRYAAIGIGVALAGLSVANAQQVASVQSRVSEIEPSTRLGVQQAALRPQEEETELAPPPAPALPPELPSVLPEPISEDPEGAPERESRDRDPFRPFTLDLQPKKVADDEFVTPLQRYDLQQLTVVGVLLDLEPPRAMLQDDLGMGYIVTPGTLIGRRHGVVTDVQSRQVIVEETYVDFYGREQVRKSVLGMPEDETLASPGRN